MHRGKTTSLRYTPPANHHHRLLDLGYYVDSGGGSVVFGALTERGD